MTYYKKKTWNYKTRAKPRQHWGNALFQLLLGCLSSSQHSSKAFWDRNLVFLIYFCFLTWGGSSGWGCTWLVMPFVPSTRAILLRHPQPEVPALLLLSLPLLGWRNFLIKPANQAP